jgi:DNA anti-recombination protein RmuC
MPVTAKLSRAFYQRLGDEVANELVSWFNAVDESYRADLRELNELNFARFDAKLEQRVAQLEAKLEQRMAQLEARLEQRMAQLEARVEQRLADVRAELKVGLTELGAALRIEMAQGAATLKSGLLKWMFGFWATTVLAIVALYVRG